MADIDELSIRIEASAEKAMPELDNLISKLTELQTSLKGLSVKNLQSSISSLGKLSIGVSTTQSTSLTNLLKTLSTFSFKSVSKTFTNVSKDFSTVFGSIKTGASKAVTGFKNLVTNMTNTKKHSENLITSLGKLYAKILIFKNIGSFIKEGINSSIDYVETYHYFETAIGKVAQGSKDLWAQYGAESAEAYADSFMKRSMVLNEKMTGYTVDENGNAVANGMKNLGLNPDLLMQYQAEYAQMADSIGMGGESSLATSMALSMIAADWASLRNISFEEAYEKMASALAGQARAVRSLGIDITQNSLQQILDNLGIEATMMDLTQAEKSMLRVIAIIEQSEVAWGDLAETIETPANQIRLLEENMKSLARTVGNIFIPIVATVLPYLNAFALSLRNGFEWIIETLGIDVSKYVSSSGGASMDFSDMGLGDDMGDLLTDGITGLDGEGEGGGLAPGVLDQALLDALNKYQTVWDSEFDNMQSKAQETSNKINEAASKIYRAFKDKDWETIGNYFSSGINGGLEAVYNFLNNNQYVSKLTGFVGDVAQSLNSIVDKVNFEKLGNDIGAGLNSAVSLALSWYGNFDFQNLGKKFSDVINGIFDEVNWEQLGRLIGSKFQSTWDVFAGLIPNLNGDSIGEGIAAFLNGVINTVNFESIGQTFASGMNVAINVLKSFASNFDNGNQLAISFTNGINRFINGVNWTESGKTLGGFVDKLLSEFATGLNRIEWENLGNGISNGITKFINSVPWEKRAAELSMGFNRVIRGLATGIGNINAEGLGQKLSACIDRIFNTVKWEDLGKLVVTPFNKIREFISGFVSDENFFKDAGSSLAEFMNGIFEIDLTTAADNLATIFNGIFTAIEAFLDGTDSRAGFDWDKLRRNLTGAINTFIWKIDLSSAASKLQSLFKNMLGTLKDVVTGVDWEALGIKVKDAIANIKWRENFDLVKDTIFAALHGLLVDVIGEAFGPFGDDFARGFTEGMKAIIDLGESTIVAIANAIKALADALGKYDPEFVEDLGRALGTLVGIGLTYSFATKLISLATGLLGVKGAISGTVGGLSFPASIKLLGENFKTFAETMGNIEGFGLGAGLALLLELVEAAQSLQEVLSGRNGILSPIGTLGQDVINNMREAGAITLEQRDELLKIIDDCENAEMSMDETSKVLVEKLAEYGVSAEKFYSFLGNTTAEAGYTEEAISDLTEAAGQLGEGFDTMASGLDISNTRAADSVKTMRSTIFDALQSLRYNGADFADNYDLYMQTFDDSVTSASTNGQQALDNFVTVLKDSFHLSDEEIQAFITAMSEQLPGAVVIASNKTGTEAAKIKNNVGGAMQTAADKTKEAAGTISTAFDKSVSNATTSTGLLSMRVKSDVLDMKTGVVDTSTKMSTDTDKQFGRLKSLTTGKMKETGTDLNNITSSNISVPLHNRFKTIADSLPNHFNNIGTNIGEKLSGIYETAKPYLEELKKNMGIAGKDISSGLANGLNDDASKQKVSNAMRNVYEESVMGTSRSTMEIHSPSAVMRDQFGKPIDEGLANGISQYAYLVSNAVGNLKTAITKPLTDWSFMSTISSAVSNIPSAIASGISSNTWIISNAMSTVMEQIKSPFYNIWSVMDGFGRQAANGFANGMRWTSIPLPHIGWNWNTITYGNGNWVQVPDFFLNWYARGGLFTTPTIAGFGEAGDEAALPLTNKGVMSRIADSIVSASDGFSGMSQEDMIEAVATGVAMAMSQNPQVVEVVVNSVLKTSDEKLAQSVERGQAKLNSRYNPAIGYNY